jgi:hypothetical protein
VKKISGCQEDRQFRISILYIAGSSNTRHPTYTADGIIQEEAGGISVGLADAVVAIKIGVRAIALNLAQSACNILFIVGGWNVPRKSLYLFIHPIF